MDDYNLSTLIESKNEWCARLTNILTPCIVEGIKSIFNESYKMCIENDEESKYLMTFQNLLNNIPKWSSQIVDDEKLRIENTSACNYLEDLITCVHISHLKSLTSSRVGTKQKKINIDVPNLNSFIHKIYINVARKIYVNVYLFEKDIMPLQIQKNNRELEIIIKECILNTIRENIPVENILRTYLDETQETDVTVHEEKETIIDEEELKKQEKAARKKELDDLKEEVKNNIKKESQDNLKVAIQNANKDLNTDSNMNSVVTSSNVNTNTNTNTNTDTDTNTDTNNVLSRDLVIGDNMNLNIHSLDNSLEDSDLNIKNLDNDPDKLNMDILDLNQDNINDDDINLEVEEL
tara:strand:- start:2889 stop:3938 length:1050 start_codon:yes stop_codon:yes gene_type:complete